MVSIFLSSADIGALCVSHSVEEFLLHAGGRVTTDTARPTKRVSVGAEAVEDAPLCTCIERTDSTGFPCRCWFVSTVVLRMIPPKQVSLHGINSVC